MVIAQSQNNLNASTYNQSKRVVLLTNIIAIYDYWALLSTTQQLLHTLKCLDPEG